MAVFQRLCAGCRVKVGWTPWAEPVCGRCLRACQPADPPSLGRTSAVALWAYQGAAQRIVLAAKNGGRVDVLRHVGLRLAPLAADLVGPQLLDDLVVTWVPAGWAGRRRRGFDQGRVLAKSVAAQLGVTAVPLLRRLPGPPQTGRTRHQRLAGPKLWAPVSVSGPVLVVDDVITTGASVSVAACALRRAGAATVFAAAVAQTPSRPRHCDPVHQRFASGRSHA